MKRRDFVSLNAVAVGASFIAPKVLAENAQSASPVSDLYYTKASPGRWAQKVATHLPTAEVTKELSGKIQVKVVTPHEMKGYEHYIVKHVLLDKNYQFIAEHLFNPMTEKVALSTHNLDSYTGTLYVLSYCNKHDLWLSAIEI